MIYSKMQMKLPEIQIVENFFTNIQAGSMEGLQVLMSESCFKTYQAMLDSLYDGYREFLNQDMYGEETAKEAEKLIHYLYGHLYRTWHIESYTAKDDTFQILVQMEIASAKSFQNYVEAIDYDGIARCIMQDERNLKEIIQIRDHGDMQEMERFARIKQAPYLIKEMKKAIDQSVYDVCEKIFMIQKQNGKYSITDIQ